MDRYSRRDRLASGVLFFAPSDVSRALSDTRRCDTVSRTSRSMQMRLASNPSSQLDGSNQEGNSESTKTSSFDNVDVNAYTKFAKFPDVLRSTRSSNSRPSLSASTPNAPATHQDLETYVELCLPIISVAVNVTVDGTVATTELKQRFRNPSQIEIPEARHTFPLYDGAILTSFVCSIGNRRVLRGVVKPKEEARWTFEKAKKEKREAAALLEELTPEIFETSLGNIPPHTTVEISLSYIHELKVAHVLEGIGLLVTVPTSIAPRYGGLTVAAASSGLEEEGLEIELRVIDNGHVNANGCHIESRHAVTYEGQCAGSQATMSSLEDLIGPKPQPQLVWSYTSKVPALRSDFIFFIQVQETYLLGPQAVLSPADETGWAALMVKLRPSDLFSNAVKHDSFDGEIIFVLDRSGSMGWTEDGDNKLKINAMRDAMSLALSRLHDTCAFNIISFGTEVRGMWLESRACKDTTNLGQASRYISLLEADMGGTNILEGIQAAVNSRVQSCASTQIILITDGEVEMEDKQPALELIRTTREKLGDKIRFFTLGIGDRVSHRMMEAFADLGGGYCDIVDVVERPRWEDRLIRMLQSAMGPASWTCSINLGNRAQRRSLMDLDIEGNVDPDPSSISYIQAPNPIPPLHPYAYKSIFFLVNLRDGEALNNVTIHTMTTGIEGKPQGVRVEQSKSRTIHFLSVKAALQDMENEIERGRSETKTARSNAEALGVKYCISSRWTSFIAVADDKDEKPAREVDLYRSLRKDCPIVDFTDLNTSGDETSGDDMGDDDISMGDMGSHSLTPSGVSGVTGVAARAGPRGPQSWPAWVRPGEQGPTGPPARDQAEMYMFRRPRVSPALPLYQPSAEGPITCQDAVQTQRSGLFILPDPLRAKLHQYFCIGTTARLLQEMRRYPDCCAAANVERTVLVDTLMMVVYFGTQFALEENLWQPIMDKAECAVQSELGPGENLEENLQVEQLSAILKVSIEHVHFKEALKESQVSQSNQNRPLAEVIAKTCQVCEKDFGLADGAEEGASKGFVCLSDECYKYERRKLWDTWGSFWKHLVDDGHLSCIEGAVFHEEEEEIER